MNMERTYNASRNIFWGVLNKIITIFMPFVTRTVMIYTMGMEYVGLGSLFTSILQVLSFAELGVGSAIVFSMYKPMSENDSDKVCALLRFYRLAYRAIGLIILFVGLLLIPFLDVLVEGDVPNGIDLRVIFVFYLINNTLGYFLFAYRQSLFTASQRVDIISKMGMIFQFFLNTLQIVILLCFHSYYAFVIVIPVVTVLNNALIGVISHKVYPQYEPTGRIEISEKKEIWKKIGGMLFQKIGNIVLTSADTLVISSFLGLELLGIFNGYYMIIGALFGFLNVIQQAIIPTIGNSVVKESVEKNLRDFKIVHFLYLWIVMWWCSCLLCLIQPFIKIWQGADNMLSSDIVILFVGYFFCYKMGDVCWMYREAMGFWWEARFIPLTSSIVNLLLNIMLVKMIGLPGILISTIVSLTIINLPWSSKVLFSKYFNSRREFRCYLLRTFRYFICMVISALITWFVCDCINESGILGLVIKTIICLVIPNVVLFLLLFKCQEFKPACKFVIKMIPSCFLPRKLRRFK